MSSGVLGSYSGVPFDDQFDDEFMDQERQLLPPEGIEGETTNQSTKCCYISDLKPCTCSSIKLPSLTRKSKVIVAIFILLLFSGLCISLGYISVFVLKPSPVLDKSYHAFSIPNHEASMNFDSFQIASKDKGSIFASLRKINEALKLNDALNKLRGGGRSKREVNLHDQLRSKRSTIYDHYPQRFIGWKMQVVFLARGDDQNIFTHERLNHIHAIEQKIMNHTQFKDFCFKNYNIDDPAIKMIDNCAPLNSLLQYFYPTVDSANNTHFDGLGSKLADIESTIKFAMSISDHFYYFVDMGMNSTHHRSKLLRTEVLFGMPLKGYSSPIFQKEEQAAKFKEFVLSYIDLLSTASNDKVQVLYGGNEIFDYEVNDIFWNDVKLASISLAAIFVIMLVLTSFSLWLTFWGIVSILMCFPLAVFFYHTVFGVNAFGILNGVAAFVIIGIGVDDVFVFINIYRQSSNIKSPDARLRHTIFTAGKATFFTSFTTAAAFAANTASSIPAVHQFGLFMSLIVSCCWVTVVVIMPAALYLWGIGIWKMEEYCLSKICRRFKFKRQSLPEDIQEFVGGQKKGQRLQHDLPTSQEIDEDDDVQLLSMDDPMEYYIERYGTDDDDEVLLIPDAAVEEVPVAREPVQESSLIQLLQSGLYLFIAVPVIKFRRWIIGFSILILVASIVLMTRLHPASKPPQLFRGDTNLQKLLDLKTSLGIIDDISCPQCSAINDVPSSKHPHYPRPGYTTPRYGPILPYTQRPSMVQTDIPTNSSKPVVRYVAPLFEMRPMNHAITLGSPATFYCSGTGTPLPSISWEKDGVPYNMYKGGHTFQRSERTYQEGILTLQKVSQSDVGAYTCVITNKVGEIRSTAFLTLTGGPSTTTIFSPSQWHHTGTDPQPSVATPKSVPDNFNMCKTTDCSKAKERPMLETGATVYVVFGIQKLDRSGVELGHVMDKDKGEVIYNPSFSQHLNFSRNYTEGLSQLCKLCKRIAARTELIKNGSAQCFPDYYTMDLLLIQVPDCQDLPKPVYVYGREAKAHAIGGAKNTSLQWWAFAFESTTSKDQSYFEAYKEYLKWEELIDDIKNDDNVAPYLRNIFQTSEFWPQVMMEVVAVNSAIYSLIFSMVICLVAVAIFTGHVTLLFIVFITILEMICLVAGIFYLAGWEMGGVEAVSLSILVGSSVDYCVHLVEGYVLAGNSVPEHLSKGYASTRQWRTKAAVSHIGVSIFSSAITTIMAAIPLTQTTIIPFSKFGQILTINSSVAIVYCLTVCTAFLAFMGPSRFKSSWKSTVKMLIGTIVVIGLSTLVLFVISKCGIFIPGPNGGALFS